MNRNRIGLGLILAIVLSLGPLVGYVSAQTSSTDDDDRQALSPYAVAIITNDTIQVQGRLTDAVGNPINSQVSLTASIYDVAFGGTARCTDADDVTPINGLFTFAMDFCTASDFNGDQLFLGIRVGAGVEMTPRQELHAVPYAWALRPGAIIKGADSYVFVPGSALVKNSNVDTTRWDIQANGAAMIYRGTEAGDKTVYFPLTLPGVLYGQSVTLKEVTIYYKSTANSYITHVNMNLSTGADSWLDVIADDTNRTSTTPTSFSLSATTNNVLSSTQGILGLYMYLSFANDTDAVTIGGIRLRLSHQ